MPTPVVHASIRPHSVFSRDRPSGTVLVSCTFGGVQWLRFLTETSLHTSRVVPRSRETLDRATSVDRERLLPARLVRAPARDAAARAMGGRRRDVRVPRDREGHSNNVGLWSRFWVLAMAV